VTRRNELVLAGVGALLVLVAATLLLVRPTRQATADANAERDTAISESQALRDQIKALEALKPKEAELKANLAKAEFPATPSLPALVDALQDAASLSGVDLGTVSPTTPQTSKTSPLLAQITTTVNVSGGYFEIQDFLVRLENLVKGTDPGRIDPRSVLIESVNLASGSEGATGDSAAATADASTSADELTGNIVLTVFQLAQPSGTSSTPAAPAAPASQGAQVR
jgi:Tfp pilus assembly protein PilO